MSQRAAIGAPLPAGGFDPAAVTRRLGIPLDPPTGPARRYTWHVLRQTSDGSWWVPSMIAVNGAAPGPGPVPCAAEHVVPDQERQPAEHLLLGRCLPGGGQDSAQPLGEVWVEGHRCSLSRMAGAGPGRRAAVSARVRRSGHYAALQHSYLAN